MSREIRTHSTLEPAPHAKLCSQAHTLSISLELTCSTSLFLNCTNPLQKEFGTLLASLDIVWDDAKIETTVKEIDTDENGLIDFKEFITW